MFLIIFQSCIASAQVRNPLHPAAGLEITTAEQWAEQRPALLEYFSREMYGRSPDRPKQMHWEVFDRDPNALNGKATRLQIAVFPGGGPEPRIDLLIYVPNAVEGPVPVFLGLNFWGNHAIHSDAGIRLTEAWLESNGGSYVDLSGVRDNRATEATRGINASQWPVEEILSRGYALATVYREEVASDREPYFATGVHPLFPELQKGEDNFGTIAAWAWFLSRALDVIASEESLDAKRVAVFGWSRLGKAALWAGATDERIALTIAIQSGAGGAKLFHRGVGEDIRRLNTVFPHWFARNFRAYIDKDISLQFDQHFVLSLIAPRPLYISSAEEDTHADPEGEFLAAKAAEPVYRLLGAEGLPAEEWPPVGKPVHGGIGYHIRPGDHHVTSYDWQQFLAFADQHLKR